MALPLSGLRILDLTTVGFGPYASQIMGEQGADIIKIETPEGDSTRYTGPSRHHGMSGMFLGFNRNKRSVVLDLSTEAGRAEFHRLVATADAVMHNVRTQKLAKLGLDYPTLQAINPSIVYAALKGFHDDGAYGGKPAYDDIIQGMIGIADLTERTTGEARYLPTVIADKTCGLFAAQAITAALCGRARTGEGCSVDVPMFESMVSFLMVEHWSGRHFRPDPEEYAYARMLAPWRRPYRALDGNVCFMPYHDAHWQRFWRECSRTDMAADPRFTTMKARTENIAALYGILQDELAQKPVAHWLEVAERLEIPAAQVMKIEDLEKDPHLSSIGFFKTFEHPTEGPLRMPGIGVRFNGQEPPIGPQPTLGQHNAEILSAPLADRGSDAE